MALVCPIVILDSNALFGRKQLTRVDVRLLLALAKSGEIRLVLPDVVLHELSRQWAEAANEAAEKARIALKKLNEARIEVGLDPVADTTSTQDRSQYIDFARQLFTSHRGEVPVPPEVSVRDLLSKTIDEKKPFARDGRGFQDALIWQTVVEICEELSDPETLVLFVSNNTTDFCQAKSLELHPDLRQDLVDDQKFEVVTSINSLFKRADVASLVDAYREVEKALTPAVLAPLVDSAVSALVGLDVEDALGFYIGQGMYQVPITVGVDDAAFDEIMIDESSIRSEIFRTGEERTISVTVDTDCSYLGFADKGSYFGDDEELTLISDWNDHVYQVASRGSVRFSLSGLIDEDDLQNIKLTVDSAVDL